MKNVSRTKKMNNILALVVMMAVLVTSIGVVPAVAEDTFTVLKSTPVAPINSTCYAKDYITVKDGDNVLTENVDYNYGSDNTALNTANVGTFTWSGVIYGMGQYSGVVKNVSVLYRVSQPVASATTTQAPASTTQQPIASTPTDTDSSTTVTSAGKEKPIEGTVTFKKFMEKYCNYGVYFNKNDSSKYTIGKTSESSVGLISGWCCSPKYQYTSAINHNKVGTWKDWENDKLKTIAALPARLWKQYTAEGEPEAINCMLDDFEKLPAYEKQLHIGNFTYGQILDAAAKVGRTVKVEVLPLKQRSGNENFAYGYRINYDDTGCPYGSGVGIVYRKAATDSLVYSNISSAIRCLNKFEVQWKRKGDISWRTGSCGVNYSSMNFSAGVPMGNGDVYSVRGKQSCLWTKVTIIKIRQYRTINGKNYYTDWKTVYQSDDGKVKTDKKSDKASSTKAVTKAKTIVKGKKAKVKVAYTNKKKIQWKSSNAKVAKVVKKSGKGYNTITIKANKAGKTTITGKGKDKTFKIKVTVKKK